jgi:hypothetical protein
MRLPPKNQCSLETIANGLSLRNEGDGVAAMDMVPTASNEEESKPSRRDGVLASGGEYDVELLRLG